MTVVRRSRSIVYTGTQETEEPQAVGHSQPQRTPLQQEPCPQRPSALELPISSQSWQRTSTDSVLWVLLSPSWRPPALMPQRPLLAALSPALASHSPGQLQQTMVDLQSQTTLSVGTKEARLSSSSSPALPREPQPTRQAASARLRPTGSASGPRTLPEKVPPQQHSTSRPRREPCRRLENSRATRRTRKDHFRISILELISGNIKCLCVILQFTLLKLFSL